MNVLVTARLLQLPLSSLTVSPDQAVWQLEIRESQEKDKRVRRERKYLDTLGVVHEAGEDDDAEHQEEDEQHQLFGGGSEGLQEDLEATGVSRQLEQSQNPNDAEELEDVRVLDVGDEMLEDKVGVEADGGHKVNNIDGRLEKITFVGTTKKPAGKHHSE